MSRILGINGIRNHGECNTDQALAALRELGHDCVDVGLPLTSLFRARSRRDQISDAKWAMLEHQVGDAVIAHSRGCLVNLRMMELGARFSTVFWFRPAMNRDYIIPTIHGCQRLVVIHHPEDRAIWLGSKLFWHDFGDAGRLGLYAGDPGHNLYDPRVENVQAPEYEQREFWRHSDDFLPANLPRWVKYMHLTLRYRDRIKSQGAIASG